MIKVKHKGVTKHIPTNAEELTLRQWQALIKCIKYEQTDYISILAGLLGLSVEEVANSDGNAEDFAYTLEALFNDINQLHEKEPPAKFELTERTLTKPRAWNLQTLGQRIAFQEIADKGSADEYLHEFLAILYAPSLYGKDWTEELELLGEEFLNSSAIDTVPTAFFFIRKQLNLNKNGKIKYATLVTKAIRRRVGRSWLGSNSLT